jgi:hypothetical protein
MSIFVKIPCKITHKMRNNNKILFDEKFFLKICRFLLPIFHVLPSKNAGYCLGLMTKENVTIYIENKDKHSKAI